MLPALGGIRVPEGEEPRRRARGLVRGEAVLIDGSASVSAGPTGMYPGGIGGK